MLKLLHRRVAPTPALPPSRHPLTFLSQPLRRLGQEICLPCCLQLRFVERLQGAAFFLDHSLAGRFPAKNTGVTAVAHA